MKKSLAFKLLVINFAIILFCVLSTVIISHVFHRSDTVSQNAARALDIVRATSVMVDGDSFTEVMQTLEKNDAWYSTKAALDQIIEDTGLVFSYVMDKNYTPSKVTYYAEGYTPNDVWDNPFDLGGQDNILTLVGASFGSSAESNTQQRRVNDAAPIYPTKIVPCPCVGAHNMRPAGTRFYHTPTLDYSNLHACRSCRDRHLLFHRRKSKQNAVKGDVLAVSLKTLSRITMPICL